MKFIICLSLLFSTQIFASPLRLIETNSEMGTEFKRNFGDQIVTVQEGAVSVYLVSEDLIPEISRVVHEKTHKCGGFFDISSEDVTALADAQMRSATLGALPLPPLTGKKAAVEKAIAEVIPANLKTFVQTYSSQFKSRFAKSQEGIRAPEWLAEQWSKMALDAQRNDIKVETLLPPNGYSQKNVRIMIPGTDPKAGVVVLGGHLDSINQMGMGSGAAPGVDDNGSGISALTEMYRVLLKSGLRTKATIEIFGYSAEELGLYGSRAIAENYSINKVNVKGAFQLDMVAFPGSTKSVTFYDDYTNPQLTLWTEQLFGLYVGTSVKHSKCGYACSDHASWNRFGFPSVFPFETPFENYNRRIHTPNDIWDAQLDDAFASQFSKLAIAYALELGELAE